MKNIIKNTILVLILIVLILFKDYLYMLFDKKEYDFNFIKEKELEYYKNEYEKIINIKNDNNYLISRIIYRNVYNFYNEITISKGENYNINEGDYVLSNDSLIGIVSEVENNSSKVSLLYNNKIQLSVKINDTYGILISDDNKLYVKNIIGDSIIDENDNIYTSGLTDIIPNILIGKVKKITTSKDKLERVVEVETISDIKKLDYVMILNKKGND